MLWRFALTVIALSLHALSVWILLLKCNLVQVTKDILRIRHIFPVLLENMSSEHLTVFAGLNQVSAGLNQFKPHVWQKQVFAGRNPTLLIVGLKQQLSLKQTTLHSLPLLLHATSVLTLMNNFSSQNRSHHFLSPAILIFVSSAVSVLTLILKQPVLLLPLLSTLNLTTVTLPTTIFLNLK